ncbi:histone deacetylase family protein [Pseudomonas sp. JV449]|jgi:acetoin utilization deacetylase AcuC-like enzyme|uniref:histone deacetylase family protein n=1 Tax=Pseudomonas sp. JV449 TaxID=1890658 RepID=UPI0028E154E3|nr:histone deacetylase family protein [Pseudomonas sp. JV449]MDT9632880.1 histone deacetylase family protein [Pseudomonas sp. JV449]
MKVFHSPASLLHAPVTYFRRGKAIPHLEQPARYELLLNAAFTAGHDIELAGVFGIEPIQKVHSSRYLSFLKEAWDRRSEIEPGLEHILPSHFKRPEMDQYPKHIIGQVGFHMADLSTPIHERTYEAVMASSDIALSAAKHAIAHGHAYGLCRPPGHHASVESAGGFCFINNTAVAAAYMRDTLNCRVGVIDIDVHHGNGTQNVFYSNEDVVTVSIHADPSNFMPYYAGYADETGVSAGLGYNLNLPLPHGSGDQIYLNAIAYALEFCQRQGVEALVVALGLDASEEDPNGALAVTTRGFFACGQLLGSTKWPTTLVQEGGYLSEILGENLKAVLGGFDSSRGSLAG